MPSHYVVYSLIWLSILFACTDINTIYYSQHNWIVLVNELLNLSKKFFKIHRSISGSGVRKTLKIIKKEIPQLKIKSFNSRKRVFDWKIPDEWNIQDAYIKDHNGKKIVDFKKNNLSIVNYSIPIKKKYLKMNYLNIYIH